MNPIGNPSVVGDERAGSARNGGAPGRRRGRVLRASTACRLAGVGRSDNAGGRQQGSRLAHQHAVTAPDADRNPVTDRVVLIFIVVFVFGAVFFFQYNNYDNHEDDNHRHDNDYSGPASHHYDDYSPQTAHDDDHDHTAVRHHLLLIRRR